MANGSNSKRLLLIPSFISLGCCLAAATTSLEKISVMHDNCPEETTCFRVEFKEVITRLSTKIAKPRKRKRVPVLIKFFTEGICVFQSTEKDFQCKPEVNIYGGLPRRIFSYVLKAGTADPQGVVPTVFRRYDHRLLDDNPYVLVFFNGVFRAEPESGRRGAYLKISKETSTTTKTWKASLVSIMPTITSNSKPRTMRTFKDMFALVKGKFDDLHAIKEETEEEE